MAFFCHLAVEKAIKAHYVKPTGNVPTRTHNLMYLTERSGLTYHSNIEIFLGILMKYQLQGRYPDYNLVLPDFALANEYFNKTKDLLQWLKKKL